MPQVNEISWFNFSLFFFFFLVLINFYSFYSLNKNNRKGFNLKTYQYFKFF